MSTAEAAVAAARACLGARFRPQGRDPATGLDCVGLAAMAYGSRLHGVVPVAYAQRGGSRLAIEAMATAAGLTSVEVADVSAGDLALLATGPGQWHLALLTGTGFIHADAGLRRVVEVPGSPPWPIVTAWRPSKGD